MRGARREDPQEDLRRVYRAHVQAVYRFFSYAVHRERAEDLTSTTFERVLKAWDRYDATKASERTWILAIARNVLTDHFRRQRHRNTVSTDEHPALVDRLVTTDDPLARALSSAGFVAWLRDLGPDAQQVLALRFGGDLSTREISQVTGHSEANVLQLVSRSLRHLRTKAEASSGLTDGSA